MAKCPKCKTEIDSLEAYCMEENRYNVHLPKGKQTLDWSRSEPVEGSCTKTEFQCPICDEVLFKIEGSSSQPKKVIAFLKD